VIVAFIALQASGVVAFDDPSTLSRLFLGSGRANAIPIPFDDKLELFVDGLPYVMLALVALSAVRLLVWPHAVHLAATATVALAVFVYFLPESGLARVLGPAIPFIGLGMALELHWLASHLLALRWKQGRALWSGALVVAALVALTPTLTSPLRTQMGLSSQLGFPVPRTKDDFSNITEAEYAASQWIAEHAPPDWAIISDPATMYFMEGLTLHPQVAQKRAWVAESEYSVEDRDRLHSLDATVFRAPTMDEAVARMEFLTRDHPGFVLVISDRTLDWFLNPEDLFRLTKPAQRLQLDVEPLDSLCGYYDIEPCLSRFFTGEPFSTVYGGRGVTVLVLSDRLGDFSSSMGSLGITPEWRQ
jgi:hypothetical protein